MLFMSRKVYNRKLLFRLLLLLLQHRMVTRWRSETELREKETSDDGKALISFASHVNGVSLFARFRDEKWHWRWLKGTSKHQLITEFVTFLSLSRFFWATPVWWRKNGSWLLAKLFASRRFRGEMRERADEKSRGKRTENGFKWKFDENCQNWKRSQRSLGIFVDFVEIPLDNLTLKHQRSARSLPHPRTAIESEKID